ncbi:MAG: diaminopimelate epimerase [candidate division KSB1 bacterium]|nr:diaminopimelate epimerase [candidate division KSB1 bacterium]MDZ7346928.1 diaminopimelate epimerase [candidate division KSB1 bacterium]
MKFFKYHGLGNDYLVLDPAQVGRELTPSEVRLICHRNYGLGSDGILWGPLPSGRAEFGLRIFNPDGSEAEKSGNGLRIFSRFLYDSGLVKDQPFRLDTLGGVVCAQVLENGRMVQVEMGRVTFDSREIPVTGPPREVLNETMTIKDREFRFCAASIGNPHCVLPLQEVSEELARTYGPLIETNERFPNRTNVQFMQVLDRGNIRIEIWERGAGYTLASGSSSCAAAAVARRLGLVDSQVTVHMPGGQLKISIGEDFSINMTGPVVRVGQGEIDAEAFAVTVD